jgi:hydrogenase nickel incorporation protein HypA/HybF
MHELPATEGMLSVALEAAAAVGATRVIAVDVVVGELTSMVDDSVQFYFDILSRGTAADGAQLRFRRDLPVATCPDCGTRTAVRPPLPGTCATCGGTNIRVEGGRAFFIESIEVDDESTGGGAGTEGE